MVKSWAETEKRPLYLNNRSKRKLGVILMQPWGSGSDLGSRGVGLPSMEEREGKIPPVGVESGIRINIDKNIAFTYECYMEIREFEWDDNTRKLYLKRGK